MCEKQVIRRKERERNDIRIGRRTKERILLERLKGESAKEFGNTVALRWEDVVFRAIVDNHNNNEHSDISDHNHRYKPRSPLSV